MNNVTININQSESLNSLRAKSADGFSVLRSAHIGNARAYNLALAEVGIRFLLVDHNVTGIDTNYRPESIIQDSNLIPVDRPGRISMRSTVRCPNSGQTMYLDELHIESMRTAFEQTEFTTNTEYLRSRASIAGEIVRLAADNIPEVFRREVRPGGITSIPSRDAAEKAKREGILQLSDNPRTDGGVIVPNEVDIVSNFAIEAMESGRSTQYHISGPDMVQYIDRVMPGVRKLYGALLADSSFKADLPEELTVELVTGSPARFAAPKGQQAELDGLLAEATGFSRNRQVFNARRKDFFTSPLSAEPAARAAFLDTVKTQEKQAAEAVAERATAVPDLFVGSKQAPYVSQYDVIASGGLYVPEVVRDMSMAMLKNLHRVVNACKKGTPP